MEMLYLLVCHGGGDEQGTDARGEFLAVLWQGNTLLRGHAVVFSGGGVTDTDLAGLSMCVDACAA